MVRLTSLRGLGGLTLAVMTACTPTAVSSPEDALQTGAYTLEGRALETDDGLVLGFPGQKFDLRPRCGEVTLTLAAEQPDMAVDIATGERAYTAYALTQGENELVIGAADGACVAQDISLVRRNESWQGLLTLRRAVSRDGFDAPPPPPARKLLFIGDSITAGAGTEARETDDGGMEAVSNARLAYPRVLGRRLDAQVHHIAYGGRGVVRDWQGITDINNAPQFYDRVLPDDAQTRWDPADYRPDLISVMLGTNDFNPGIPEAEAWTQAYADFLTRIQGDYPGVPILLISSPMTGGEKGEAMLAMTRAAAARLDGVEVVRIGLYPGQPWDSHPHAGEHAQIAEELLPYFRRTLSGK